MSQRVCKKSTTLQYSTLCFGWGHTYSRCSRNHARTDKCVYKTQPTPVSLPWQWCHLNKRRPLWLCCAAVAVPLLHTCWKCRKLKSNWTWACCTLRAPLERRNFQCFRATSTWKLLSFNHWWSTNCHSILYSHPAECMCWEDGGLSLVWNLLSSWETGSTWSRTLHRSLLCLQDLDYSIFNNRELRVIQYELILHNLH